MLSFMVLLLVALPQPASDASEPADTFVRVFIRGDITGRTEMMIHKSYGGEFGPIRDIIPLQSPDVDGYPRVEVTSSGAIKAVRELGRIVVESTGPGQGAVDIFIVHNDRQSSWQLQMSDSPGVGTVRANVVAQFPDGVRVSKEGNGLTVQQGDQREELLQGFTQAGWRADADSLPSNALIWLNISYQPIRLAPLWVSLLSLAVACTALAIAGFAVWKGRKSRSA